MTLRNLSISVKNTLRTPRSNIMTIWNPKTALLCLTGCWKLDISSTSLQSRLCFKPGMKKFLGQHPTIKLVQKRSSFRSNLSRKFLLATPWFLKRRLTSSTNYKIDSSKPQAHPSTTFLSSLDFPSSSFSLDKRSYSKSSLAAFHTEYYLQDALSLCSATVWLLGINYWWSFYRRTPVSQIETNFRRYFYDQFFIAK